MFNKTFSLLTLMVMGIAGIIGSPTTVHGQSVIDVQVSASADDAYHAQAGWLGYSHTNSVIYAGSVSSQPVWGGWRWTGLNIPENSQILNAYVEFNQSAWGYVIPTTLSFENAGTPASFSSVSTPQDRWTTRTNFELQWTWPRQTPDSWIQTPDLTTGIQELVDTYGAINEIVLLEDGSLAPAGQNHSWATFDSNPSFAARLHIEYESGVDTTPPTVSNGQPTGVLPSGTTEATLQVDTDEGATCKYDVVAGVDYASMANTFATTGGTTHSSQVTGLTDGGSYTYYVKCEDTAGNATTSDTVITFSVAVPDTTPPVVSNGQPTGTLPSGTTQATLQVDTDENATCAYNTTGGLDFSDPAMVLFTTTGTLNHSTTINGLTDDTSYSYYVRCEDVDGNATQTDYEIAFTVLADTTPPVVSNGQPTGVLPSGTTQTTISVTTNENSSCRYDTVAGNTFSSMLPFATTGGTTHSSQVTGLVDDTGYTFYVKCQDELGNTTPTDYNITFSVAAPGPTVIDTRVNSSSDDAYHVSAGWPGFDSTQGLVYAGRPGGSGAVWGGWRWTGLNIPSTATIQSAYVEFEQDGWGSAGTPTTLSFEDTATPLTFTSSDSPATRWTNRTSFELPWTWAKSAPGSLHQTPDLTAGIQELVNTHGSLNEIVLLEDGTPTPTQGDWHGWTSFDGSAANAPLLHIEYTFGPDTTPPTVSNGQPTGVLPSGTTEATLQVDTDEGATCKYDVVAGVDYASMANTFATTGGTTHSSQVTGLTDGGSYTYYVKCEDTAGNATTSDTVITFSVAVPGESSPNTPILTAPADGSIDQPINVTLQATVSHPDSELMDVTFYGAEQGSPFVALETILGASSGSTVSSSWNNLLNETTYEWYVEATDASADTATSTTWAFTTQVASTDTTPPQISAIQAFPALDASVISWETDEDAISQVIYGTDPGLSSTSTTAWTIDPVKAQAVGITGLNPETTYYFQVHSQDTSGNETVSPTTPLSFTTISATELPTGLYPDNWPTDVQLAIGESYDYVLRDGSTRTLTLVSYAEIDPMNIITADIQVSDGVTVETHTIQVAHAGTPVSLNGLRVYGYVWKEANNGGFESVGMQGGFPLSSGKDVGFAVSDAAYPMYPELDQYTYPVDQEYFEGAYMQNWLEANSSEAHSGNDIGLHYNQRVLAITDGYLYNAISSTDPATEGSMWLMRTNTNQFDPAQACWIWTHIRGASVSVPDGTFVKAGTPIGLVGTAEGFYVPHTHMGSCLSFDFGSWLFPSEIWNAEHASDTPSPRYWLALGAYSAGIESNHIATDETNDLSETVEPKIGEIADGEPWRFADNFVHGVTRMAELMSAAPFSGLELTAGYTVAQPERIGYAATYVYSPTDHTSDNLVHLKWGLNNAGKVWLNGTKLFDGTESRFSTYDIATESPIITDAHDIVLPLKQGWNTLIFKTNQGTRAGTAWLFSAKIGDSSGAPLPELTFSTRGINLEVASSTQDSVSLTWTAPADYGTFTDGYYLDVAKDAGFTDLTFSNLDLGNVTSYTVNGLTTGTTYYFRVSPYNTSELGGTIHEHYEDVLSQGTVFPPLQSPPGGLSASQTPQFVLVGSDDNNRAGGMEFFLNAMQSRVNPAGTGNSATYDGTPARGSFYLIGTNIYGPNIDAQEWRDMYLALYNDGHEIGNHAFENQGGLTLAGWQQSLGDTHNALLQLGIAPQDLRGIRAPEDAINPDFYDALEELGYEYGNSSITNHSSNSPAWWPGTLENGWPGGATWDSRVFGNHPGIWEIPQTYATGSSSYCDKSWFDPPTNGTGQDWREDMQATFQELYNGNRAPLSLCLHSQDWGPVNTGDTPSAQVLERQQAFNDFLDWLLSGQFPEVRIVTHAQLLDWMQNPVAL